MFKTNLFEGDSIIKSWTYTGEIPDYYTYVPVFVNNIVYNIDDDNTDPFFRLLVDLNQPRKNNDYRKIGQLLTNRNIEDLTLIELSVALSSLGYDTTG